MIFKSRKDLILDHRVRILPQLPPVPAIDDCLACEKFSNRVTLCVCMCVCYMRAHALSSGIRVLSKLGFVPGSQLVQKQWGVCRLPGGYDGGP